MEYEQKFVDLVLEETDTRIARLSHISRGSYTAEHYETQMIASYSSVPTGAAIVLSASLAFYLSWLLKVLLQPHAVNQGEL